MGRIKEYYFNEIDNIDNFDDFFEDEMEAMYQPIFEDKKAAKAAAKDLKEEFIDEEDGDDLYRDHVSARGIDAYYETGESI